MRRFLTLTALTLALSLPSFAQSETDLSWIEESNSLEIALTPVVRRLGPSVVEIKSGEGNEILGTVVAKGGWVITKASALFEDPECDPGDGNLLPIKIVYTDRNNDLALVKVTGLKLPPVKFAKDLNFKLGQCLASPSEDGDVLSVGVIGVLPRSIPQERAFLGVRLEEGSEKGVAISEIVADSAAEEAGLKAQDIIKSIQGQSVADRETLIDLIGDEHPGSVVKVEIVRGEEKKSFEVRLKSRTPAQPVPTRGRRWTRAPRFSTRKTGFDSALQHDGVIRPSQCGGPIVNIKGEVCGINIARATRYSTLAVTPEEVQRVIANIPGTPAKRTLMPTKIGVPEEGKQK